MVGLCNSYQRAQGLVNVQVLTVVAVGMRRKLGFETTKLGSDVQSTRSMLTAGQSPRLLVPQPSTWYKLNGVDDGTESNQPSGA